MVQLIKNSLIQVVRKKILSCPLNFLIGKCSCKRRCLAAVKEQNPGSCDTCASLSVTKILKRQTITPCLNSLNPLSTPLKNSVWLSNSLNFLSQFTQETGMLKLESHMQKCTSVLLGLNTVWFGRFSLMNSSSCKEEKGHFGALYLPFSRLWVFLY